MCREADSGVVVVVGSALFVMVTPARAQAQFTGHMLAHCSLQKRPCFCFCLRGGVLGASTMKV